MGLLYLAILVFVISKHDIDKFLAILFAIAIPFINDINIFSYQPDFHVISNQYFTFNILHIITILLFVRIIIKIKLIKFDFDLLLILLFNIICIISIFYAINPKAAFYDYIRYFNITIIYIYFSRIFKIDKNEKTLIYCLIIGLAIQLIWGLLQKIIDGPIGLYFLGEKADVFRLGVSGYEKGMSGTFGHPGPYALYGVFLLAMTLFNYEINRIIKLVGIVSSTIIVILAAGRTGIALMIIIYFFFYAEKFLKLNTRNIKTLIITAIFIISSLLIFNNQIQPVLDRFTNSDISKQADNRLEHIVIAKHYISQNPMTGVGLNNYLDATNRDFSISFKHNFFLNNPIHNIYLLYAVEIGIIGTVIFILFLLNTLVYLIKSRKFKDRIDFKKIKGYALVTLVYIIYNFQGWGGVQNRSLIIVMLSAALTHNIYRKSITNFD